jgi:hypothetical protein
MVLGGRKWEAKRIPVNFGACVSHHTDFDMTRFCKAGRWCLIFCRLVMIHTYSEDCVIQAADSWRR